MRVMRAAALCLVHLTRVHRNLLNARAASTDGASFRSLYFSVWCAMPFYASGPSHGVDSFVLRIIFSMAPTRASNLASVQLQLTQVTARLAQLETDVAEAKQACRRSQKRYEDAAADGRDDEEAKEKH